MAASEKLEFQAIALQYSYPDKTYVQIYFYLVFLFNTALNITALNSLTKQIRYMLAHEILHLLLYKCTPILLALILNQFKQKGSHVQL